MDSLTSFSTSAFCLSKHRVASLWLLGCPFLLFRSRAAGIYGFVGSGSSIANWKINESYSNQQEQTMPKRSKLLCLFDYAHHIDFSPPKYLTFRRLCSFLDAGAPETPFWLD